jgi:hypothetical protein
LHLRMKVARPADHNGAAAKPHTRLVVFLAAAYVFLAVSCGLVAPRRPHMLGPLRSLPAVWLYAMELRFVAALVVRHAVLQGPYSTASLSPFFNPLLRSQIISQLLLSVSPELATPAASTSAPPHGDPSPSLPLHLHEAPGRRPSYLRPHRRRPTGTPPIRCISTSVTAPGSRPPYPRARRRRATGTPPLRCLSMSVTVPRSRPLHQPLAANQGCPSVAMRRSRTEGNVSGCHKNN